MNWKLFQDEKWKQEESVEEARKIDLRENIRGEKHIYFITLEIIKKSYNTGFFVN